VAPVPSVLSERLELVSMPPSCIVAFLAGDRRAAELEVGVQLPAEFDAGRLRWLRLRLRQMEADRAVQQWLARLMVPRRGHRRAVGHIGFHEPPDSDGWAEVGYTVFPEHRGQGLATEACRALFAWAGAEHGVTRFRASVSATNGASLAVVRKLGFLRTGVQWDAEDGEELVFALQQAASPKR
jgi:RimJ/RimL family protein N-acetyltransferase